MLPVQACQVLSSDRKEQVEVFMRTRQNTLLCLFLPNAKGSRPGCCCGQETIGRSKLRHTGEDGNGNEKLARSSGQESWNVPFFNIGSYSHISVVIVAIIIIIIIILLWKYFFSINFAYVEFVGYNVKVSYRRHVLFG
jgi:hypothetical protein